jgi:hypothetical protein
MKENLDLPNPFEYGTFVTGEQFCGRSKEITELRKAILVYCEINTLQKG